MPVKTPQQILNSCLILQTLKIIETIFQNSEKEEMNMEELIEKFQDAWVAPEKIKQKRIKKDLSNKERCIALKKNKERCNGRKYINGENHDLCSIHNNNGCKHGMISNEEQGEEQEISNEEQGEQQEISNEEQEEQEISTKAKAKKLVKKINDENQPKAKKLVKKINEKPGNNIRCKYKFIRGNRKGGECSNLSLLNNDFCKLHNKSLINLSANELSDEMISEEEFEKPSNEGDFFVEENNEYLSNEEDFFGEDTE